MVEEHKFPKFTKEEQEEIEREVRKIKDDYKKINEDVEDDLIDERKTALANYLEVDKDEIEYYDMTHEFEVDGDRYLVFNDDEADEAVHDDIDGLIYDMGLEAFTPDFQERILEYYLEPAGYTDDVQRESAEAYIEDIESEGDNIYDNRLLSELVDNDILSEEDFHENDDEILVPNDDVDLDDAKETYVDMMCEEDSLEWFKDTFGMSVIRDAIREGNINLDIEGIVDECIYADGRGHFLAIYDGEELQLENGLYAYRID